LVDPGVRVVERPRLGLRKAAAVAAVVLVARGVDDVAQRHDVVGVAMAVLEPDELAVGPAHLERALAGAPLAEVPADPVPGLVVASETHDARVVPGIADPRVDRQRTESACRRIEPGKAVAVRLVG